MGRVGRAWRVWRGRGREGDGRMLPSRWDAMRCVRRGSVRGTVHGWLSLTVAEDRTCV
jgi:hypothetical protein